MFLYRGLFFWRGGIKKGETSDFEGEEKKIVFQRGREREETERGGWLPDFLSGCFSRHKGGRSEGENRKEPFAWE